MNVGLVELFGPVDREAERRPAELVAQHRHGGGVGSEMRVHVGAPRALDPARERARFGQVDGVAKEAPVGPSPNLEREFRRAKEAERPGDREAGDLFQDAGQPVQEDVRPLLFCFVGVVFERFSGGPNREPLDLEPQAFDGRDLATDEGMTDLRILVDEVGQSHGETSEAPRSVDRRSCTLRSRS